MPETGAVKRLLSGLPEEGRSLEDYVLAFSGVGAAAIDARGCYVSANNRWAELLSIDSATPMVGAEHFGAVQNVLSRKEFEHVRAGNVLRDQMVQVYDDEKRETLLRWSAFPIEDDVAACVVILRDITRSETDVRQLIQDRDQLRFALDGADYGLWDWNVVTGEVYFSKTYMNMLGYKQFELPHNYDTWSLFCKPGDVIEYEAAVEDYLDVGEGFLEDEFEMRCKDGSYIWVLSRGKIVSRRPDGSPLRIVGTHQDVTERKMREAQLVVARDEAEEANRAKSDFLALISHEVRTPLNGITSVLELLADEDDAVERSRLSRIAFNSSEQLLRVLSDVLDMSKMEAGRFDIQPRPVALKELVEELTQTHAKAAEAKSLGFRTTWKGGTSLTLQMDSIRVTQVLTNFLSNAIKFTEEGFVDLEVETPDDSRTNTHRLIRFTVTDTGEGLSPEEQKRLFQPFYQARGARSRDAGGTGLGLSICKKLAGMMDGRVWCESEKGKGSYFFFEAAFPLADMAGVESVALVDAAPARERKDIRVLAAEDNPVNQIMLKKFLVERMGYPVTIVGNGEEVLSALEAQSFDIILMDVHMPRVDGVEATKMIRATEDKPWHSLPIIALTADAADTHVEEYREAGMNTCVSKPVKWQELDAVIQGLVAG